MVLHEIWSLGHKPFNDLSNPIVRAIISNTTIGTTTACVYAIISNVSLFFPYKVIALVNSKHCQAPPPGCSRAVYQLMVQCW